MLAISATSTWEINCPKSTKCSTTFQVLRSRREETKSDMTVKQSKILQRFPEELFSDKLALICCFKALFRSHFQLAKLFMSIRNDLFLRYLVHILSSKQWQLLKREKLQFLPSFLKVWQNSRSAQCTCLKLHQLNNSQDDATKIPNYTFNFENLETFDLKTTLGAF